MKTIPKPATPLLAAGLLALPAGALAESTEERVQRLEAQVETLADLLEARGPAGGHGSGATRVGGYGELHYQNLEGGKEMDFHRFVLFFGHDFSDRIRFESEVELEHAIAGEGQNGAIELEQAYLHFDLGRGMSARGGLFLVPVGILNETHEPPTFYGVERNPVEKHIIPTTWWEGGAMLSQRLDGGWSWDLAVHSGLKADAGKNYAVRNGRQKVSEAPAEDLAATARVRWSGLPGVSLAASLQRQGDITQGSDPQAGAATLWSAHAVLSRGPFAARALVARWNLEGAGPRAVGADVQQGWYVEPAWRPLPQVGLFARYAVWNNRAGDQGGADTKSGNLGVNYWPHPDVVLKAEYQNQTGTADDGVLLGIGYQF